jgi:hypothetical protein
VDILSSFIDYCVPYTRFLIDMFISSARLVSDDLPSLRFSFVIEGLAFVYRGHVYKRVNIYTRIFGQLGTCMPLETSLKNKK